MKHCLLFVLFMMLMLGISACDTGARTPTTTTNLIAPTSEVMLTISAAADLIPAFTEIGERFTQHTNIKVVFNFGSTGQLTQQILQGAPVDVFAAANQSFIQLLANEGRILPDTRAIYAVGRITLWTRRDSPLTLTVIEDLRNPAIERIAIANPEHAPYGVAAREALQSAGLWDELQPKLVFGENIAQTLQFADSGNVDVAIVALSLSVQSEGRWVLLPENLHNPLIQALAVIDSTPHEAEARAFALFVNGDIGHPIMRRYGFVLPGEEPFTVND